MVDVSSDRVRMRVVRLDPDLPLPSYAHPGDAGMDLVARVDVFLAPGARAVVPTGVSVQLPAGMVGLVHPRSGLAAKLGVTVLNAPGTIDEGYRGEVGVILVNSSDENVHLYRGDRIAQLVVQRYVQVDLVEVDDLSDSLRGGGGFGSPLERDPEQVAHDVREGYVSQEAAHQDYGVVVSAESARSAATAHWPSCVWSDSRNLRAMQSTNCPAA